MLNTFRVNEDGSIETFSGGLVACLAWKGVIDPADPDVTLTAEQRENAISARDQALAEKCECCQKKFPAIALNQLGLCENCLLQIDEEQ